MEEVTGVLQTVDGTFAVTIKPMGRVPPRARRTTFPKSTRVRLLMSQDYRCGECRAPLSLYESHIDHIVPLAANGTDDITNLQLVHMNCNLSKGRKVARSGVPERMPWA
jgi:5-methylcytosine-specific restriction endonuclease McrA